MRWVTQHRVVTGSAIALAMLTSGCAALAKAAAFDPAALAMVPVALAAQAITAAGREDQTPSNGMINVLPNSFGPQSSRDWDDPDDWVAECDGPMLCSEHEQFACSGVPGDCFCDCVPSTAINPNKSLATTR